MGFLLKQSSSFWGVLLSSIIIALASLGDALLYMVLPIHGEDMGFSMVGIGLLLSVNRWVRIVANTSVANLVARIGTKKVLIGASCLAVVTTFCYGLELGLLSLLIARIAWGLSYSGLKLATLNYAAMVKKKGLAFGLTSSIKVLGGVLAFGLGPVLLGYVGLNSIFAWVALISLSAVFLAFLLPKDNDEKTASQNKVTMTKTFQLNTINLLVFVFAIVIDGILVVALSTVLMPKADGGQELLQLIAFYLLLKRLFLMVISLVSGLITLKVEVLKLFNLALVMCLIAIFLITMNVLELGIVIAFLFNTIIVAFAPVVVLQLQKREAATLQAISSVSTWWDLGAALGAMSGIFLIKNLGTQLLFGICTILIAVLFIRYWIEAFADLKKDRVYARKNILVKK